MSLPTIPSVVPEMPRWPSEEERLRQLLRDAGTEIHRLRMIIYEAKKAGDIPIHAGWHEETIMPEPMKAITVMADRYEALLRSRKVIEDAVI